MEEICSTPHDAPAIPTARVLLCLAHECDFDNGLIVLVGDESEGPVLQVVLHDLVREVSPDQALGVEDGVHGV